MGSDEIFTEIKLVTLHHYYEIFRDTLCQGLLQVCYSCLFCVTAVRLASRARCLQVRSLLQPSGPLFSVIYRLMAEPHVTYEFPAACLPVSAAGGGGDRCGVWTGCVNVFQCGVL